MFSLDYGHTQCYAETPRDPSLCASTNPIHLIYKLQQHKENHLPAPAPGGNNRFHGCFQRLVHIKLEEDVSMAWQMRCGEPELCPGSKQATQTSFKLSIQQHKAKS